MDAEFVAQTLCLEHGWQEPNTLGALQRGLHSGTLPDAQRPLQTIGQLRRVEGILRRWSTKERRFCLTIRRLLSSFGSMCFESAEAFREAVRGIGGLCARCMRRFVWDGNKSEAEIEIRKKSEIRNPNNWACLCFSFPSGRDCAKR
jgi:hypothetical protein